MKLQIIGSRLLFQDLCVRTGNYFGLIVIVLKDRRFYQFYDVSMISVFSVVPLNIRNVNACTVSDYYKLVFAI